jgi:hypothetical protein
MKEEMENRKEDWVHKGMECKDESSSDSSSEGAKEKSKGKKAQMGWDLQIILTGTGGFSIRVYAAVSPKLQSPKTFEHPGYLSIMPAMTRKQEIVACLRVIACEKICLSCWLPYITPYLDESLGPRFKIIVIPVSHYHLLGKKVVYVEFRDNPLEANCEIQPSQEIHFRLETNFPGLLVRFAGST